MYLFLDTETTGLSHHNDHIVQLAWALTDEAGNIKAEECHVIRPDGYSIPPMAAKIHGITTAKACEIGLPLAVVLKRLSDAAARATIVVAHNLSFDLGILQHDYKIASLQYPLHGKTQICTMRLSATWCRLPKLNGATGFKYPKLDELYYRLFGEGFDGAHDALADTHACRRCYFELVRLDVIAPPSIPVLKKEPQDVGQNPAPRARTPRPSQCIQCGLKASFDDSTFCPRCQIKFTRFQESTEPNQRNGYTQPPEKNTIPTLRPTQSQEADPKEAWAQYNFGTMYDNGRGVPQDYAQAANWYRKAADQGLAVAQRCLGNLSNGRGVSLDYVQAVYWYRKAADQGDAVAQNNLGKIYLDGKGVSQDWVQALMWFRKAAEQGSAMAQFNIGIMYANGRGVAEDKAEAMKWYRMAADLGYPSAQFNLGTMYYEGQDVPQQTLRFILKTLGATQHNDKEVPRDYAKAMMWFRKAADQGEAGAQFNLGAMYTNGDGVSRSNVQAMMWYFIAKAGGSTSADKSLQRLESQSPQKQISEAQKLAREWMAAHPQKS